MSSQFLSFIAFSPIREGDALPANLRAAIINSKNQVDTTQLQHFVPEVAGEGWSKDNYCWLDWGTVRQDRDDYFEIDMDTNFMSARAWMEAVSVAFPSVRIALRGDDDDNHFTEHYILEGGNYLRDSIENAPTIKNMNLLVALDPMCELDGTWMERVLSKDYHDDDEVEERNSCTARVRSVLKAKSASSALLWRMGKDLDLTPKQHEMLTAHPNFNSDFEPDLKWWLG